MQLSPQEAQLLRVVASDLRFLREEWDQDVSDDTLRRTSTVLRRMLSESDILRAWKAAGLGPQPKIHAPSLTPLFKVLPPHAIAIAMAGGAQVQGAIIQGYVSTQVPPSPELEARITSATTKTQDYRLSDFPGSPSIVVKGSIIKRHQVITYVANKLGGAHFDTSRGHKEHEQFYSLLDFAASATHFMDKPLVYFELLSIGQALVACSELSRIEEAASGLDLASA